MTSPTSTPAAAANNFGVSAASAPLSIGFVILIIILGLLVILLLACIGHSFWSRHRARRRGEDPGPVLAPFWWRMRNPVNGGQGRGGPNDNAMTGGDLAGPDARGREFYNVASEVNTHDYWKGDAATLPRYG